MKPALAAIPAALALAVLSPAAQATTYNLANFPFSYVGANSVEITVTTSQTGTFSGAAAIAQFFNDAAYSAVLGSATGPIVTLNNGNSSWAVLFSQFGNPSATLHATASQLVLDLNVPQEFTSAGLYLAGGAAELQYLQDNNNTDQGFVWFGFDMISWGQSSHPFGQAYTFDAITAAVPEPASSLLLAVGTLALLARARRRRTPAGG